LFRHVRRLRFSGPSKVTRVCHRKYELDMNGVNTRREGTRPVIPPRAGALDAELPVRFTIPSCNTRRRCRSCDGVSVVT